MKLFMTDSIYSESYKINGNVGQQDFSLLRSQPTHDAENVYYFWKRVADFVIVCTALPLLVPLMLLIALIIKLDSVGPVFFTHERVGARKQREDGKLQWDIYKFPMFKFRSMVHNADQALHEEHVKAYVNGELEQAQNAESQFKLANDPRITRCGRILRKTSLDELPQLINVLRGEMSLVGPRPVPEYEVALYQQDHYERLTTLPGMTGLWQIEGRGGVTFEEMIKLDTQYVRNKSLWLDLKILLLTIPATILGKGAT